MAINGNLAETYLLEFEKPIGQFERQIKDLEGRQAAEGKDYSSEIRALRATQLSLLKKTYAGLRAWETVLVARHKHRPLLPDYIDMIVRDFRELHGDRNFRDDSAMMTGFGRIGAEKVMVVGHHKGRDTKEKMANYFGCAHPEGYRKAMLKMRLAAKFHLPVVTLIDTPGAYPGIGAEERGQAQAIAVNLMEMSRLPTPIVCVVIGEGGSGGALGIGVGDRIAMMEYAYYSVISPEGCAAILWRSGEYTSQAAEALKLTAGRSRSSASSTRSFPSRWAGPTAIRTRRPARSRSLSCARSARSRPSAARNCSSSATASGATSATRSRADSPRRSPPPRTRAVATAMSPRPTTASRRASRRACLNRPAALEQRRPDRRRRELRRSSPPGHYFPCRMAEPLS